MQFWNYFDCFCAFVLYCFRYLMSPGAFILYFELIYHTLFLKNQFDQVKDDICRTITDNDTWAADTVAAALLD